MNYSEITPEIRALAEKCVRTSSIDSAEYSKYQVNRGLRDINGNGVLTGLTEISEIKSKEIIDGRAVPCSGKLYYRGYDVENLVSGFMADSRFGFEETVYLLLFGELPDKKELTGFTEMLSTYRSLPTNFVRDIILKAPATDMMNTLARGILTMYAYDENPDSTEPCNVLRQCIQIIAVMPLLSVYAYQAYRYYHNGKSLYIHNPDPERSTAENLLRLLRSDKSYTALEARVLDLALVLHAEHGGGNNSTFTTHVVSSSGTDTYSSIAASLCSLKGPKHGGANNRVVNMFDAMKKEVSDWSNEDEIAKYLRGLLEKTCGDRSGLIYGMGHAVYSQSDPRATILRESVKRLATEKHMEHEFMLYENVERIAPLVIAEKRSIYKGVSANVDFYSGLLYNMLDLPKEMYTPIFAVARSAGWSAHRIEELINASKIIRPAYQSVARRREYKNLAER